jgi:hypothetical protein
MLFKRKIKTRLRNEIMTVLKDVQFPINNLKGLLDALPNGENTVYKVYGFKIKANKVEKVLGNEDFPLENPEKVADIILKRANF